MSELEKTISDFKCGDTLVDESRMKITSGGQGGFIERNENRNTGTMIYSLDVVDTNLSSNGKLHEYELLVSEDTPVSDIRTRLSSPNTTDYRHQTGLITGFIEVGENVALPGGLASTVTVKYTGRRNRDRATMLVHRAGPFREEIKHIPIELRENQSHQRAIIQLETGTFTATRANVQTLKFEYKPKSLRDYISSMISQKL